MPRLTLLTALLLAALFGFALADDVSKPASGASQTAPSAQPAGDTIQTDAAPAETHKCFVTGLPWDNAPGRVEAIFVERGRHKRAYFLNMGYFVATLASMQQEGRPLTLATLNIVDFDTVGKGSEAMLDVDRDKQNVWFVWTQSSRIKDAKPPYVYGFGSEEAANAFVHKGGGKVYDYASLLKKLGAALAGAEGKGSKFEKQPMDK